MVDQLILAKMSRQLIQKRPKQTFMLRHSYSASLSLLAIRFRVRQVGLLMVLVLRLRKTGRNQGPLP